MQLNYQNPCSMCNRSFATSKGLKIHQNTCKQVTKVQTLLDVQVQSQIQNKIEHVIQQQDRLPLNLAVQIQTISSNLINQDASLLNYKQSDVLLQQVSQDQLNRESNTAVLEHLNAIIYKSQACFTFSQGHNTLGNIDIGNNYFKYMMKNPKDLSIEQFQQLYPWTGCIIQAKADGTRCLLLIENYQIYLVFESFMQTIGTSEFKGIYVFECEYMSTNEHNSLLVYDMHMWDNQETYKENYFYRIWKLKQQIQQVIACSKFNSGILSYIQQKPFVSIKNLQSVEQLKQIFTDIQKLECFVKYNETVSGQNKPFRECHHTDGVIINTNNNLQFQHIYKWKPKEQLTIDFLCKRDQVQLNTFQLFSFNSTTNESVLFNSPIIDCSSSYIANKDNIQSLDLDNKVAEFLYHTDTDSWEFIRIRIDKCEKGRGNALNTARNILSNILYNISFELLFKGTDKTYFEFKRTTIYANMTRYVNYIKQISIQTAFDYISTNHQLKKQETITALDLGCGKGQDIQKFQRFSTVYCVDNDKYALWELSQRASSLNTNTKVRIQQNDLFTLESVKQLPENIDFLNCNIALHYFVDTLPAIIRQTTPNYINLVIVDGSKLKESETLYENGKVKYHYKMKQDASQPTIYVKLPFQQDLNEERILYPEQLEQTLEELGYQLTQYNSLMDSIFADSCIYTNSLSVEDKQHINHYSVLQFVKSLSYDLI